MDTFHISTEDRREVLPNPLSLLQGLLQQLHDSIQIQLCAPLLRLSLPLGRLRFYGAVPAGTRGCGTLATPFTGIE
jgi:hypothetical protein